MQEDPLFQIEVIPQIKGFTCKALLYALYILITFGPLFIGVCIGYFYNIWAGIAFFLFLTLASVVVISKMRINSIPFAQREMNYTNFAVVRWYLGKNICL
jgi:hypothetical protein